jgi:hypothetical protein
LFYETQTTRPDGKTGLFAARIETNPGIWVLENIFAEQTGVHRESGLES